MARLSTGAPIVQVYHEKSIILPDVSRVLACLYEKDIKFKTHTASYKSLLRLQASSHAPVPFYDGPTFLEESREICHYIAEMPETYEHHGYPFLLGKDALERASVEQWLHNEEHAFNPPSRALFCHLAFPLDEEDDGDDIDMHTRKLEEVLEVYEQRLSDSEFLAGNKFTLADLVHLPNSHYITASNKFLYLYDSRKNVRRWWDAISTRDSWQQVLRDMKRVEEQNKQEELKKQQQQQQKDHPRTSGSQIRIDPRRQTSTEPRTILVPPAGTVSSSPIVPQTEKPLPTDTFPDEALVSSSQSTPTDHKTSVAQSKETTFFTTRQEKPAASVQSTPTTPQKSPIPVQSTITPATSPTTAEKPPIVDAAKFSTTDASSPEPTEADLPNRHKPSSSTDVSNNLHVFDYYKESSHTEEATPYIEPTPQKTSETLDTFSGSSIAAGHPKTSPTSAKEDPNQPSAYNLYKSDSTGTGVDSQDKEPVPYFERTPQTTRPTDTAASKLRTTNVHHKLQAEQWHAATAGLSNLKEDADRLMLTPQVKPSKDVQQYPPQDSEQATSHPVPPEPMSTELVQGREKTTQRPFTDWRRDVSSPLSQQTGDSRVIAEDEKASSDLPPSTQEHAATPPSRKAAAKDDHSSTPSQAGYPGGQGTNKQPRDSSSVQGQTTAQDTFRESRAASSTISSGGSSDAFRSPLPRQDLDAARHATAPFQKRYTGTEDTTKQDKGIISTPWQMADQGAEDTTEETKNVDSSSSRVQPLYFQRAEAPSGKQQPTEDLNGATSPVQKRHTNVKDTAGQSRDVAFKPKQMIAQDDQDIFEETKSGDPSSLREQPSDTRQAATTPRDGLRVAPPSQTRYPSVIPSNTRYPIAKDASRQPRGTSSTPRQKAAQDDNDTSEESRTADEGASTMHPLNAWGAPIAPRRQEVEDSPRENTSFQKRYPCVEDMQVADTASVSRKLAPDGGKDTFEETKQADSTPSAKPMYTQRASPPPSRQAEVEDTQDKGKQSRVTSPEPQKMVTRDAKDAYGERKTGTPGEQSSDRLQAIPRSRPAAAKGARGKTGETIQFPDIIDTTKKSRGTFEETEGPGSTLPRSQSFGAQDAQRTNGKSRTPTADQKKDVSTQLQSDAQDPFQQSKLSAIDQKGLGSLSSQERDAKDAQGNMSEEKPVSTEQLQYMIKKSESTAPKAQPTDSQGSIKVEKTSSVYQKEEQAQIIPAGEKGNGSTPKHQHASDAPYAFDEKLSATAPARAKTHDDFGAEEPYKKDTTNDQKMVPPLLSKEPTSQAQPPSESLHKAAPYGDLSTKPSTIDQWQHASAPLNDVTTSSGDDEMDMLTIDQKPTPMSQQAIRRAQGANQVAKESGEERVEQPVPTESEPSGVQRASQSFPSTAHHATIDDKLAKQSIIDERVGEPAQMQAPTPDGHPASAPTKRATPNGHGIGDLELVSTPDDQISESAKARHYPATVNEYVHDTNLSTHVTKDTFKETKVADSTPSSAKPMYTQRPGLTPSSLAEVEDTRDEGMKSRETIPEQQKIVERKIGASGDKSSDRLTPAAAEDARGATGDTVRSPDILDTSKKPRGTFEEAKGPVSTLPKAQSLGAQDAQRTKGESTTPTTAQRKGVPTKPQSDVQHGFQEPKLSAIDRNGLVSLSSEGKDAKDAEATMTEEKSFSTERLREMLKEGESTTLKAQPTDSQGSIKEDKTSSSYQKMPLVAQESQEQAQTIPAGKKADGSILENQQASEAPYNFDEKLSASAPARAKTHDDFSAEEPYRKETTDDQKVAPPLLSKEPNSHVQPPSDAAPHGDLSSTPSTIYQWQRASAPLPDVTTSSGEQPSDHQKAIRPSGQAAAEDARGATGDTIQSPDILDTTKKSRATFEETKDPDSTIPKAKSLGAQDAQHTNRESTMPTADQRKDVSTKPQSNVQDVFQQSKSLERKDEKDDEATMTEEKSFSTERLREMRKESESTVPKAQPTDSQGLNKVEKTLSVHQESPLAAQESQEHAQIIPAGEKAVSSTPKHQQASGVPYTVDEKLSASTPTIAVMRDDHSAEEPYRKNTADGQKVAPPLLSKEPPSQVQPPTDPLQGTAPGGNLPSKSFTIDQRQPASAPLHGVSSNSGDAEMGMSNVDRKPVPMSQEATLSSQSVNQAEQSGETPHDSVSSQYVHPDALGKTELSQPTATDQEATASVAGPASTLKPQIGGTLSDQESARAAQPLSPVEPVKEDSNVPAADYTNEPQIIFRQQARPPAPSKRGFPDPDTQGVTRKIQELTLDNRPTDDSGKSLVPSQEQVSHASQAIPGQDMTPAQGTLDSPTSDTQLASKKVHEVTHDDRTDESMMPFLSSSKQGENVGPPFEPGAVGPAEKKFAPSDQGLAHSAEQPLSTEPRKEQTVVPTAEQINVLPTVIGQQDTPDTREVPTSKDALNTKPAHGDVHPTSSTEPARRPFSVQGAEPTSSDQGPPPHVVRDSLHIGDVPADGLGNAQSMKPSASPDAQHGITTGNTPADPTEQKKFPSAQDSVHSTQPPSSAEQRNEEIGDSALSTQWISSTRPKKGDVVVAALDQAKDSQTTLDRQDILPAPVRSVSPSSDTQHPSGTVHEDVPADDLGEAKPIFREAKPIAPASAPDTQHGTAPDEVAPDAQKSAPSGQGFVRSTQPTSSTEPRNKEIRDSAPLTQLISSTETRKEDAIVAAPDQVKDLQTTLGQQDILSAPVRSVSPSSDTQRPLEKGQEDAPADDLGEAKSSKPPSVVREVKPPTVAPALAPATQHDSAQDEVALDDQKFVPSGQDSAQSVQPSFSTELTKEDTAVTAADQAEDLQTRIHQQDIAPAPYTAKTPLQGTQDASKKIQQITLGDRIDDSLPSQEQVSLGGRASEPREGQTTDPYRTNVDEKTTTSPSSQANIPDSGSDLTPTRSDVHPSGEEPTETFPEHGAQTQPPAATQDVSLDASSKGPTVDLASSPDTQCGAPQLQDEAAPVEHKIAVSDRESAHASKSPSSAEPRKGETYAGTTDQANVPQTVFGDQAIKPTPDAREALWKDQESSRNDDHIGNLVNPLIVRQEQDSHAGRASEGPTSEARSAFVDNKTTLPSSQAQTSNTGFDSTPISGDAHLSRADVPATRSLQNQSSKNTPADSLEKIKSPRQPSTDQVMAPVTSSAAPSDIPQGTEPGQDSAQSVQPSFSTEPTEDGTVVTAADQAEDLQTRIHQKDIAPAPDSGSDLTPTLIDGRPSIGEGAVETFFPEHGEQTQPPAVTQDVSLDTSSKAKSASQEAKAPTVDLASAADTQPGAAQPQGKAAPSEQKNSVSDQESARASKSPSSAEPRKRGLYAGIGDKSNVPQTIFGDQATSPTPDAREALSKDQESSRDDDHLSSLANPLIVSQEVEQASHAGRASDGPIPEMRSAVVEKKTTFPSSQAQPSNIGPDSTPISGDAHPSSADVPATKSLRDQVAKPPAATQAPTTQALQGSTPSQNVHADSLEKIETPRQGSKDQVMAPVTSAAAPSDAPQGTEPGTNSVQPPQEASFDLSSDEKTTMTQGDQVNTLPNGDLLTSQIVGQSESAVSKGNNSQKNLEGASKAQQQNDQFDAQSSKETTNEVNGAVRSNISTTFGEDRKQPSWPKESLEPSEEPERQQQADQAIVQSLEGNKKQVEQSKAHDTIRTGEPEEREPPENTNEKNNRISQEEALGRSDKQVSGVQLLGENTKDASNSSEDAPGDIQTSNKSEDSLRSSEESKVQLQPEGKTEGGEAETPISETEQTKERVLPEKSDQNNSRQFHAEASDKSVEQSSPGIQNKNKNSSRLDGPTDTTKSGDMEDNSQ